MRLLEKIFGKCAWRHMQRPQNENEIKKKTCHERVEDLLGVRLAYLKEKAEKDFTLKEQELELKKTEQEIRRKSADAQSNQFQCVMEQQRALFESVQQQQAQQEQQNNLLMQTQTQTTQAILAMMDKIAKK